MQTKDMHEAKNWYEKAIQIDPSFPDTYNNLGIILYSLKDYKKAIACYEKAIEIKPNFPDAVCCKVDVVNGANGFLL